MEFIKVPLRKIHILIVTVSHVYSLRWYFLFSWKISPIKSILYCRFQTFRFTCANQYRRLTNDAFEWRWKIITSFKRYDGEFGCWRKKSEFWWGIDAAKAKGIPAPIRLISFLTARKVEYAFPMSFLFGFMPSSILAVYIILWRGSLTQRTRESEFCRYLGKVVFWLLRESDHPFTSSFAHTLSLSLSFIFAPRQTLASNPFSALFSSLLFFAICVPRAEKKKIRR